MVKQASAVAPTTTMTTTAIEPIDRLEEKLKRLVEMVAQLRAEKSQAADEQARLSQEIATLRARLNDAEQVNAELTALRDERELIRRRVADMLSQLEAI